MSVNFTHLHVHTQYSLFDGLCKIPDMVKRAKEVMHYEAYSQPTDYWWWSDALYMVMPVMTKMYKLTGDTKFLDKLYDNLLTTDEIMLDKETNLY